MKEGRKRKMSEDEAVGKNRRDLARVGPPLIEDERMRLRRERLRRAGERMMVERYNTEGGSVSRTVQLVVISRGEGKAALRDRL